MLVLILIIEVALFLGFVVIGINLVDITNRLNKMEMIESDNSLPLRQLEKRVDNCFSSEDAVQLFDKAVGAVRQKTEDLEQYFKIRSEYFLTKEMAIDLFKEYQEQIIEDYKKYKDGRWDRITEAFTRK